MIFYVLFVFSIFVSATCRVENATDAAYEPTDVLFISCGAKSDPFVDTGNRMWWDDYHYGGLLPWNAKELSFAAKALYQDFAAFHVPFMEARIFRSNFTYIFQVSTGWKFLRLYFYPTRYGSDFNANGSFFSVSVNGFTLLKNFSAYLTVMTSKPESKYLIKEFIVPVFKTLRLTFTPSPNSLAFVNGVEIVSMPDRFYTKGGYDDEITNVSSTVNTLDEETALETLYLLNVGGHMVSAVNDTGMFKVLLKHYTFAEVKKITKSFSHTIGKGGFGTVYGGNLCNGRKVAVKVLKDSVGNGEDFINEVASMSQTSHRMGLWISLSLERISH
ncbi:putative receptor-like protein kinase [Raphanus sativus]|nr:putative receptor-like protein kinase [Raphanus sativus]